MYLGLLVEKFSRIRLSSTDDTSDPGMMVTLEMHFFNPDYRKVDVNLAFKTFSVILFAILMIHFPIKLSVGAAKLIPRKLHTKEQIGQLGTGCEGVYAGWVRGS